MVFIWSAERLRRLEIRLCPSRIKRIVGTARRVFLLLSMLTARVVNSTGHSTKWVVRGERQTHTEAYVGEFQNHTVTGLSFVHAANYSEGEALTLSIHEHDGNAHHDLGVHVADLTTPALTSRRVNFFAAPEGTTLKAGTKYILAVHSTGGSPGDLRVGVTDSDEEMGATGWSIEHDHTFNSSLIGFDTPFRMEVRGVANLSNVATLSDLVLTDSSSTDVALTPEFQAETINYSASVGTDINQITITLTKTDDDAEVAYLDGSGSALTDTDSVTEGFQLSLSPGNNTFKVQVTAADGNATETYTVDLSRTVWEATLTVRDLINGDLGCANGNTGNLNCTNGSTLTDDGFTYDSTSYDVTTAKVVSSGTLRIEFSSDLTSVAQTLILHVGSETFRFRDADSEHSWIRYWLNSGITWTIGTDVELKLTAAPPSDDATLSGLGLEGSAGDPITLDPTFVSDNTSYTDTVDNVTDVLTVTPMSDYGASFEYLDGADKTLADSDTETDGHQVSLVVGDTTVKVKATAEDGNETEIYTVVVTRLTDSNLVRGYSLTSDTKLGLGTVQKGDSVKFRTGSHAAGYMITSVGIYVPELNYSPGETVTAYIHEFDDSMTNDRGTEAATLTTPTLINNRVNYFTAPSGTTLAADTQYILNFHSTGNNSNDLGIRVVTSNEETGATGWLIEDAFRSGGSLSTTGSSMSIEVRGNAIVPSDDATLSDLAITDSNSADVALDPTFESDTTDYAASVDSDVSQITSRLRRATSARASSTWT